MTETQMFCKPSEVPTRAENEPVGKILSNWHLNIGSNLNQITFLSQQ